MLLLHRLGFVFALLSTTALAHEKWTELNIGPFYVDTQADVGVARTDLTQLEQTRWVLGGLLESKELQSLWPIRVLLTKTEKTNPIGFVSQQGQYILVCSPETPMPLEQVARILLDANTQKLPDEVEKGLPELFSTLDAHGSHVVIGKPPANPDLAWARMQLFATKFEYGLSFHIFLAALKDGTDMRAAERNAFGKDPQVLEQEVAAYFAAGQFAGASVSGRPLDPRRDFGEHTLDGDSAAVYLANANFDQSPNAAEQAYKDAVQAGGEAAALGYLGLAVLAEKNFQNPKPFYDKAIQAGSRSALAYVGDADGLDAVKAIPLLKRAAILNPLWAEPIYQQAKLTTDPKAKLDLLKQVVKIDPRGTEYWVELAQLQTTLGDATAAQGSWARAQDSAPTAAVRAKLQKMEGDSESERLEAEENAEKRERNAAILTDLQAQQAEDDRIRAAEQKANQAADAKVGDAPPDHVVDWDSLVPQKNLVGTIVKVDCLGSNSRLEIRDRKGTSILLLLKDGSGLGLACGTQKPARSASVSYSAQPDDRYQTAGQITKLKLQ